MRTRKIWTEEERKTVAEMFADNYTETVCRRLDRSYRSVVGQAKLMGLKKSKAFLRRELSKNVLTAGVAYRYPKGNVPMNKGKKMPPEVYQKAAATMFKKGGIPHNAIPAGGEVLRKDKNGHFYRMIKTAGERRLKYKHIYLWESRCGKVQKGYNVVFKDGDTLNCTFENLECISNEELMYRNSKANYPREVIPSLMIINKLKKKINEKQND